MNVMCEAALSTLQAFPDACARGNRMIVNTANWQRASRWKGPEDSNQSESVAMGLPSTECMQKRKNFGEGRLQGSALGIAGTFGFQPGRCSKLDKSLLV